MILIREIDGDRRTVTIEPTGPPSLADERARKRIDDLASTVGFHVLQASAESDDERRSIELGEGFGFQCLVRGDLTIYRIECPRDLRLLKRLNALLGAIIATSELGDRHTSFNVAVYELLANSIEHGSRRDSVPEHEDTLNLRISICTRRIAGVLTDRCTHFNPFAPEVTEHAHTSAPALGPRGYGLRLVKRILDDFRYRRTRDGNILLFAKDLQT